jgi:hypothetical protein
MNHPAPRIQFGPLRLALSEVQGCGFCGQRPAEPQQPDPDPAAVLAALKRSGTWENPTSLSDEAKGAYVVGGLGDSWLRLHRCGSANALETRPKPAGGHERAVLILWTGALREGNVHSRPGPRLRGVPSADHPRLPEADRPSGLSAEQWPSEPAPCPAVRVEHAYGRSLDILTGLIRSLD